MRFIQQKEGFSTTELDYVGSTESYHYFEQEKGKYEDGEVVKWAELYRVPREELAFTDVDEMPYKLPADKKVKVKISSAQPFTLRKCKDKNKETAERLKEYRERAKGLKERLSNALNDSLGL